MATDLASRVRQGVAIVAVDGLAARQWEAALAATHLTHGEGAWLAPNLLSYRAWADALWIGAPETSALPLTALQSGVLWRRIVAESPEAAALVGSDGAAEWAAEAWRLLCHWLLDPAQLQAAQDQPDFRAFLSWCRRYREELECNGWVDHATIDARLPAADVEAPPELVLADPRVHTPAQTALLRRLEEERCRIEHWDAPSVPSKQSKIGLPDAAAELHAAAAWVGARAAREPRSRIAVVVADLARRRPEIDRWTASLRLSVPVWQRGRSLAADPLLGAALNAIELLTPEATFSALSRWLRSPFFGVGEESKRALLERRLRSEVCAQLPLREAYFEAGWRERLRSEAANTAAALDRALAGLADIATATPSRWVARWQKALTRLGWPPLACAADDPALLAWQAALTQLGTLTPILGAVSAGRALHELERIVQASSAIEPLPLAGLHVLGHVDEVGPGYDAVWVTGFTDSYWPPSGRVNPLLPLRLQREHRMPWHSPQDARERAAESMRRLLDRVPAIVISWPARVYDYATEPSPAIRSLPELPLAEIDFDNGVRTRSGERFRETVDDAAPALAGTVISGGTSALNRQARCPLRAFCEFRLGARPLEPVTYGLPGRLQGIVAHRALELLLQGLPTQGDLAQMIAKGDAIARCVEQALSEILGGARRSLSALFELERRRHTRRIGDLLCNDVERAPFKVDAVERRLSLDFQHWELRARVDRVDRLDDGSVAVIDYKTGDTASSGDWLTERLRDTQVPLYAVQAEQSPSAVVLGQMTAEKCAYTGFWQRPAEFPGRSGSLPNGRSWAEQLPTWRRQIRELIEEFAAGDVRVFVNDDIADARGAYSPLTRALEQLALHRGTLRPW
jgi:ATP-dependent helicase/nuclease subunit B